MAQPSLITYRPATRPATIPPHDRAEGIRVEGIGAPRCRESRQRSSGRRARRRGLAPLEMVMWLPILLFVMALMVNFGTFATWRVRGEVVSRHAAWRTRWPRTGIDEGRQRPAWPLDAEMTIEPADPIVALDDPQINAPVVRGPLPNGFYVYPILDPDRIGAFQGVAEVDREFPLLPRLGDFESGSIKGPLLDLKWQSALMGIPNRFRRVKILYELPRTQPALPRAFASAVRRTVTIPHYAGLRVLDRDRDILRYTAGYVDFHPRTGGGCELDLEAVYANHVRRLIDTRGAGGRIRLGQISRLPSRMASYFLNMYQRRWDLLEAELNRTPPPTPRRRAEIQAEMAELRPKIDQLEAYQSRMGQIEADLERRADAEIP